MNAETIHFLGSLEVLALGNCHHPIVWDSSSHGNYSFWALMAFKGFVSRTDVDLAFRHWQLVEAWGAPTDLKDYEYAPLRDERKSSDWSEEIALRRSITYKNIAQLVETQLDDVQAYRLSVPKGLHGRMEWSHPKFSVSLVVGVLEDGQWLCLLPTVPDQLAINRNQRSELDDDAIILGPSRSAAEIPQSAGVEALMSLLEALAPIELYGYYHGGYNYSYQHSIVGAISSSKEKAIENALQAAKMLVRKAISVEYVEGSQSRSNSRRISQFMNKRLKARTAYSISFFDIACFYELGRTPGNDWIGTYSMGEFEFNP